MNWNERITIKKIQDGGHNPICGGWKSFCFIKFRLPAMKCRFFFSGRKQFFWLFFLHGRIGLGFLFFGGEGFKVLIGLKVKMFFFFHSMGTDGECYNGLFLPSSRFILNSRLWGWKLSCLQNFQHLLWFSTIC